MKTQDLNKTSARQIILTTIMQDGKISVSDNRLDNQDLVNDLVAMISDLLPKQPAPINDSIPSPATLSHPQSRDSSCGHPDARAGGLKHTALPWTIGQYAHHDGRSYGLETGIFSTGEQIKVAVMEDWKGGGASKESDANAEFIVRAVNAHDELVAACEAAIVWLMCPDLSPATMYAMEKQFKNAVAKAKD